MSERIEAPQKVECTACGYETLCRLYPRGGHMSGEEKWLCKICANTLVGTAIDYRHYGDQLATMKTVAYVGNAILDAQARALIDGLADFLEHRCPYVEPPKPEPCEAPRMLGTIMLHRCQKPKGHNGPHEWSEFSGGVHAWSQWEDEAPRSPSEQQTVAPSATLEGDRE